jgi:S-adenosylmethionine synthetase
MSVIKKIFGFISAVIAAICALGVITPTHSMSISEVMMGKATLALVGFIFASLAYYLLRKTNKL